MIVSKKNTYTLGAVFVFALILGAGIFGYYMGHKKGSASLTTPPYHLGIFNVDSLGGNFLSVDDPGRKVDFSNFWVAWNVLEKNFVPSTTTNAASSETTEARILGAIEGLARSYDDPYTIFIPKETADVFKEQVNAEFEGIGAALTQGDGLVFVTAILPHSPASQTDLSPGDRITEVNGEPIFEQNLEEIVSKIRGPKGSTVVLTVLREEVEKTIPITRGVVAIPTTATQVVSTAQHVINSVVERVKEKARTLTGAALEAFNLEKEIEKAKEEAEEQEFFILRLSGFAKTSVDAFVRDLTEFANSDTRYLIIDLRNNPGGFITVAVDLASYFLPRDTLVVSEITGKNTEPNPYKSHGHDLLQDSISERRIIVLLNRSSASASEILAGALQDHGLAVVVGETSFGKGSVQQLVDVRDIGSLKVTVARWFTPSGRDISQTGITPDIEVNLEDSQYASSTDPYIDAATEVLLDDSYWGE